VGAETDVIPTKAAKSKETPTPGLISGLSNPVQLLTNCYPLITMSMAGLAESLYPLKSVTDTDLQNLTQVLWNWDVCNACRNSDVCENPATCSWKHAPSLQRFFDFYKHITSFYVPELLPGSTPALGSHQDLLDIVRLLQAHPSRKRSELTHDHFSRQERPPLPTDQHRAFNLAVQVMTMVNCSADNQPFGLLELGTQSMLWHSNNSLAEFMGKAFPEKVIAALHVGDTLHMRDDSGKIRDVKAELSAKRLKKVAGLSFQGTDDLRNHLKLDVKKGVVEIYHYTSVLKQHLMASSEAARDPLSFDESIPMQVQQPGCQTPIPLLISIPVKQH